MLIFICIVFICLYFVEKFRRMDLLDQIQVHLSYWEKMEFDSQSDAIPKEMWHRIIEDFKTNIEAHL